MSLPTPYRKQYGFTLTELTVCTVIVFLVGLVIAPLFRPGSPCTGRPPSCMSNQKWMALGFLQYVQDNDDNFPPAVGDTYIRYRASGKIDKTRGSFAQSWGPNRTLADGSVVEGLLRPYTASNLLFIDPSLPKEERQNMIEAGFGLCYMYNDLLAMQKQQDITATALTVLTTDAENRFANVGHAFTSAKPLAARFTTHGTCEKGQGASVGQALFRHAGGSNFAFTDGHVKWYGHDENGIDAIFFPPRESDSQVALTPKTKKQLGPIPGTEMTFEGHTYLGTFHLR